MIDDADAFLAVDDMPEMSPPNPRRRKNAASLFVLLCSLFIAISLHLSRFIPRLFTSPVPKFVFCCAEVCVYVFLIPVPLLSGLLFPSPTLSEMSQIVVPRLLVPQAVIFTCVSLGVVFQVSCVDECHD